MNTHYVVLGVPCSALRYLPVQAEVSLRAREVFVLVLGKEILPFPLARFSSRLLSFDAQGEVDRAPESRETGVGTLLSCFSTVDS